MFESTKLGILVQQSLQVVFVAQADHIAEEIKKLKPDPCSAGLESIKASLQASLSAAVSEWQGSGHQDTS